MSINVNIPSLAKATLTVAATYVLECTETECPRAFNATEWTAATADDAAMPAFDTLQKRSDDVYQTLVNVMQTRELSATVDDAAVKDALNAAAGAINNWFVIFGTRPGKGGTHRPLVCFNHADLAIFAEATADCRNAVRNKTAQGDTLSDAWLYFMITTTARILRGQSLERADLTTAIKTRKVKTESEKAEAKAKREAKKAEQKAKEEAKEKELADAKATIASMAARTIDVAKLTSLIIASSATDDEKQEMLKLLNVAN